MALWKQLLVGLALLAGTGVAWALYVPAAAPLLERLRLPAREAAEPAAEGGPGGFGGGAGPVTVAAAPLGEGRANARVAAIGDARSLRSVAVTPLDAGRLVAVEVESGAKVAEGQVLARLDDEAEAIALERAALAVADAEATYERVAGLVESGAATDVQEREARLALDQARLEERDAALALERRTIEAPIGGVVGLIEVERGQQVTTETEIAVIEDRSSLLVEFRAPERAAGLVAVGDAVTATPPALPGLTLEGRVAALDNRVDAESRTLRVQAVLPNADDRLRAGMAFAIEMRLPGDPHPEIDALSIQWSAEGAFVWVARDGRALRQPVRIVQRNGDRVLVEAEFTPGDRVVTEGVQRLRDGAEVRLLGEAPGREGGLGLTRVDPPASDG